MTEENPVTENPKDMFCLPNELLTTILLKCSVEDLCSIAQTCRKFRDCILEEYLWYQKWKEMLLACGLELDLVQFDEGGAQESSHVFLERCKRLWAVNHSFFKQKCCLPKCSHCGQIACSPLCLDMWERKVALDIGSKTTWLLTTTFALQRHPSVLVTSRRNSETCLKEAKVRAKSLQCLLCRHRSQIPSFQSPSSYFPVSEYYKVSDGSMFLNACRHSTSQSSSQNAPAVNSYSKFSKPLNSSLNYEKVSYSKKFSLWSEIHSVLHDIQPNCEITSPIECFSGEINPVILNEYIHHLLEQFGMLEEVRKPNVSLVFCEPYNCTLEVRKSLVKFLFEDLQVARLCFLNKAYSIALLIGVDTCLVIDTGATNTVITVILNGEVKAERTRHCPVGGVVIAQHLAEAIRWNGKHENLSVASLDTSRVKSCCYLSYNIAVEERRMAAVKHNVFVRYRNSTEGSSKLEKVELGAELYLAPEIMYTSMNLPDIIKEMISGLDANLIREALGHVLLTGSNSELNGFATRLIRDLQRTIPEYRHIINVHTYAGSRSWDAVMGATRIVTSSITHPLSLTFLPAHVPNSYIWISREEYILNGFTSLEL